MSSRVTLTLTNPEIQELLLTTSFNKDELLNIKRSFEVMQSEPQVVGKVSFKEFCTYLEVKEESVIGRKLFDKLDSNHDGLLTYFDLVYSLDCMHQKQFKPKLKFYFELLCENDKQISRAKLLKLSKELVGCFPQVVLPEEFILEGSKNQELKPLMAPGQVRRNSSNIHEAEDFTLDEVVTLDNFFDHFEGIFGALV